MQRAMLVLGVLFVAAVLTFVGLLAPWWGHQSTVAGVSQGSAFSNTDGGTAAPFKGNDLATSGHAATAGILVLLALLAVAAAALSLLLGLRVGRVPAPLHAVLAFAGTFLLLLAALLALLTWPGGEQSFWGSDTATAGSLTITKSYYAHAGWYLALAAGAAAAVAGVLGMAVPAGTRVLGADVAQGGKAGRPPRKARAKV